MTPRLLAALTALCIAIAAFAQDKAPVAAQTPAWLQQKITAWKAMPPFNPPRSVVQVEYKGKPAFYVSPACCDIPSDLYDASGSLICHPSGGFAGGDGKCRDYVHDMKLAKVVWQDDRPRAVPKKPLSPADAKTVAELTKISDAWDKAIVRKDRKAIADNMAEDFRQIGGSGTVETKESFVQGLMADDLRIDPYTVEDFEVRLHGDVALLSGRTRMTGTDEGKPFSTHYRYIDIYVRRNGTWKIVSVQTTRMPADAKGP